MRTVVERMKLRYRMDSDKNDDHLWSQAARSISREAPWTRRMPQDKDRKFKVVVHHLVAILCDCDGGVGGGLWAVLFW